MRSDALPLLLPQPHPRHIAIGELDSRRFQRAPDRREIVRDRLAGAVLEIAQRAQANLGASGMRFSRSGGEGDDAERDRAAGLPLIADDPRIADEPIDAWLSATSASTA